MALTNLILFPILGSIIVLLAPNISHRFKDLEKELGLIFSVISFWMCIGVWLKMNKALGGFQMVERYEWILSEGNNSRLEFLLGVDGISIFFLVLTALLIPICILASWDSVNSMVKEYIVCLLVLESLLFVAFTALDIITFYIFFESTLIPMFFIIGNWGSRKERIQAAFYLFLYTLGGSVLMLIGVFTIYQKTGITSYELLLDRAPELIGGSLEKILWLSFFASFAVKIPMIPLHLWLPQAHTEAPVAGSVILAGILLKLGGYGFIRYSIPMFPEASEYFVPLIFLLSLLGVIYASLTTLRQIDLKRIIAYSSVSHMALVTLSAFTFKKIGVEASIFLMIAHGITSSALFICITNLYERFHTRIIKYYRGISISMPIYALFFAIFSLANLGLPLTANFIGEFLSLLSIYQVNTFTALIATLGVIFSAAYSLFLYNRVSFGSVSPFLAGSPNNRDLSRKETYVLLPLILLVFLVGIFPDIILSTIHSSVYYYY